MTARLAMQLLVRVRWTRLTLSRTFPSVAVPPRNHIEERPRVNEQQNLLTVQRIYKAIAEGDIPARLNLVSDDFELCFFGPMTIPWAGTWRGKEGLEQYLSAIAKTIEIQIFVPESFISSDDQVVVLGRERCRLFSNGCIVETNWAHAWKLRDGLVCRHEEYSDTAAWVAAFEAK
jgi:uncharacterized protein